MLKYLLPLIILVNFNGYGQSATLNKLDSLIEASKLFATENPQESRRLVVEIERIAKQSKNTDNIIKSHKAFAEFYIANKLWTQAEAHIDTAISLSKGQKEITPQIDLLILLSKKHFKSGDYSQSKQSLLKANQLASKINDNKLLISIKLTEAEFYKQRNKHIESIKILNQALDLAQRTINKELLAECYQSIGSTYWQTGHFNESLENYYKSILIKETLKDSIGIVHLLKNIGLTYREIAQYEKGVSSLEKGLAIAEQLKDSLEIADMLNSIGSLHYKFNRFEEASKFYSKSLEIRKSLGLIRSQIVSYENIARTQAQRTLYAEALENLSTALSLQEFLVDPLAEASTLTEMGNLNLSKGNVAEALRRYLMALKIRQSYGRDEDVAKSLTNIGLAYRRLGMFKSATKYFEQAHEIINKNELNINDASYILQNLGHIYLDQKKFKKALSTYKEALSLKEKGGDDAGTAKILKNIAQVQLQIKQVNGSRATLTQALKISSRIKDQKETADIYNEMGNVERQAHNYEIAIKHFKKASEIYQSLSNFDNKALCIRKIGEILIVKKQYLEAEEHINQSIKIGSQTGNAYLKSFGYLAKHDLYKAKGSHKLALLNYVLHTKIKDSLETLKRNEANLEAQLDLELDQKKTEIKVMEAEVDALRQKAELDKANIEKQQNFRNFLIVVILLIITLLGTAVLSFWQKRKYANALEDKIDEINLINEKLIESEIHLKQTLKTKDKLFSIIAHDLRSPFTALVGLSEVLAEKSKDLTPDEVSELSKHIHQSATGVLNLTDNLLSWSRSQTGKITINPSTITLKDMVDEIVTVASIPAKEKQISVNVRIDGNLKIFADYDTISTAIRNLVSNAIKFTPTGGNITLKAQKKDNYIDISVIDSGVGIDASNLVKLFRVDGLTTKGTNQESGTGLGLILCKEFVEKNKGKISVESTLGLGTTFTITIPSNDQEST